MKKLLLLLFLLPAMCHAQVVDSTISQEKIGINVCRYAVEKAPGQKPRYFISLSPLDVTLERQGAIDSLIVDIEKSVQYVGKKVDMKITGHGYAITVNKTQNMIFINDHFLRLSQVKKLLAWLRMQHLPA